VTVDRPWLAVAVLIAVALGIAAGAWLFGIMTG